MSSGPWKNKPVYNIEQAIDAAVEGKGWRQIAEAFGCSMRYLFKLMEDSAPLKQSLYRAREMGLEARADQVNTLVEDNEALPAEQRVSADLLRIKMQCVQWFLAVSKPSKFGQRQTIAVERVDVAGAIESGRQRAGLPAPSARLILPAGSNDASEASHLTDSEPDDVSVANAYDLLFS